jgi:hypothetical protein
LKLVYMFASCINTVNNFEPVFTVDACANM